jgi:hydroxyethylthiazole kinase-like uncharacterized protein yjeF
MKHIKWPISLSQPVLDTKQVKLLEAEFAKQQGIPLYALMERAGSAALSLIHQLWPELTGFLLLCGKGNNGGDGLVLARLAHQAGLKVTVLLACQCQQLKGDGLTAYQHLMAQKVALVDINQQTKWQALLDDCSETLIVDCLYGTGFRGQLSQTMLNVIMAVNAHQAQVLSLDIPSGLIADTGHVASLAINADVTLTFIAIKQGLITGQAANHLGHLYLDELGVGGASAQNEAQSDGWVMMQGKNDLPQIPKPLKASHKGILGLVLAIGGNVGMPGAIRLAATAALRCGAAQLAITCHQNNQVMVHCGQAELMLSPCQADELAQSSALSKARVILLGPGLGRDIWAQQLFSLVIQQQTMCVLDADALHLLADLAQVDQQAAYSAHWVLTPHPGEAAHLLGCSVIMIELDRFAAVKAIAQKYGGICILKGAGSLICDGRQVWVNTTGNAGMATAGMGDILSGIIAAMLVQVPNLFEAARLSTYLHGQAADTIATDFGQRGMLASDLLTELRRLVNPTEQ